jgi:hypothetical protein
MKELNYYPERRHMINKGFVFILTFVTSMVTLAYLISHGYTKACGWIGFFCFIAVCIAGNWMHTNE